MNNGLRIALVHDYLTQRGGAERVVQAWVRALRPESLSTLVWNPDVIPAPEGVPVLTSSLQRFALARRDPRSVLPALRWHARRLEVPATSDVVLVSTSGFAHNVMSHAPTVVYWHTPARWLHQPEDYRLGMPPASRAVMTVLRPFWLRNDARGVRSADIHLCNSTVVQRRLRRAYGIEADVLHPPVEAVPGPAEPPARQLPERFFLTVSRKRGYKNTELLIAAAQRAGVTLVRVGDGLQSTARDTPGYINLGNVSDPVLKWLYGHAEALVSAAREDFGLTPLEANLEGTPAVVVNAGGFTDSIVEGLNGRFFASGSFDSCVMALKTFRKTDFNAATIARHVETTFSVDDHIGHLKHALNAAALTRPSLPLYTYPTLEA